MKNQRRMEIIEVTPDLANEWLLKNTKNRPLKPSVVEAYASAMAMDKWTLTPEAVVFSAPFTDPVSLEKKPETLMDGQHRLAAVIQSGKTVKMTVWFGCEPEEFGAIGQGRRRTNGDILHITNVGLRDPFTIASAVSAFLRHTLAYSRPCEPWIVQELLTLYPVEFAQASRYKTKLRRLITRPVMAALLLARLSAATKTDELVDQLHTGIGFGERDPGRFLYRYLHDQALSPDGGDTTETIFYKVCNALHMRLNDRKCEMLVQSPNGLAALRADARKRLEPALRVVFGSDTPSTYWTPKVSSNRQRLINNSRRKAGVPA